MIRITQLKLSIDHSKEELIHKIQKALRLKTPSFTYEIVKQSLDCRHKEDKKFVYTIDVSLQEKNAEEKTVRKIHDNNITLTKKKGYVFPSPGEEKLVNPPVVVRLGFFAPGTWQRPAIVLLYWRGVKKRIPGRKQ